MGVLNYTLILKCTDFFIRNFFIIIYILDNNKAVDMLLALERFVH